MKIGIYFWWCVNDNPNTVQPSWRILEHCWKPIEKLYEIIDTLTVEIIRDKLLAKYGLINVWSNQK